MIFAEENKVSCCNISPAESLHGFIENSKAPFISLLDTIALIVNLTCQAAFACFRYPV